MEKADFAAGGVTRSLRHVFTGHSPSPALNLPWLKSVKNSPDVAKDLGFLACLPLAGMLVDADGPGEERLWLCGAEKCTGRCFGLTGSLALNFSQDGSRLPWETLEDQLSGHMPVLGRPVLGLCGPGSDRSDMRAGVGFTTKEGSEQRLGW